MNRRKAYKRLDSLAARQHGLVARRQAVDAGLSDKVIARMRRDCQVHSLGRGVYRLAGAPSTWVQSVMAACLATGGTASHGTALRLYGLPTPSGGTTTVTLLRGRGRPGMTRSGIRQQVTRSFDPADRRTVDRVPVTSPERTLLDLAHGGTAEPELEVLICGFFERRLLDEAKFAAWLAAPHRRPGITALRRAARTVLHGGRLESVAELRLLQLFRQWGVPEPVRQFVLRDDAGRPVARFDQAWPDARFAVEMDGYAVHGRRAAFDRDRLRDVEVTPLGWEVLRVSPSVVLENGDQVVQAVLARVAGAGAGVRPRREERRRTSAWSRASACPTALARVA